MELIDPRSALLSNFEVLSLLRELDADHLARAKTAVRIKKEEDASGKPALESHTEEVSENLRTVELEAIQYLSADYQPTCQQSEAGVHQLVRNLAPFGLTKAEQLQVVNLAPTEAVELYVIVEELEDRLGDRMGDILGVVSTSLSGAETTPIIRSAPQARGRVQAETYEVYEEIEQGWEHDADDIEFDDMGDGAGVEGDLDVDDD